MNVLQQILRTVVLVQSADQGPHLVIPQLDIAIVQRSGEERERWMEGDALDPVTLRLELQSVRVFVIAFNMVVGVIVVARYIKQARCSFRHGQHCSSPI